MSDKEIKALADRLDLIYDYQFEDAYSYLRRLKPVTDSLISTATAQQQQIEHHKAIAELAVKALKLFANGNNNFPTWADTVDVLKDVRSVAKETLSSIQRLSGGSETP